MKPKKRPIDFFDCLGCLAGCFATLVYLSLFAIPPILICLVCTKYIWGWP